MPPTWAAGRNPAALISFWEHSSMLRPARFTAVSLLAALCSSSTNADDTVFLQGKICSPPPVPAVAGRRVPALKAAETPLAKCGPAPTGFHQIPSVGKDEDTRVALTIGYDS